MEVYDAWYSSSEKYRKDNSILSACTDPSCLSDEDLEELATPLDYSSLVFQTETYRSGKHHIKKTRYKDNPWGKIIGRHEGAQFYTLGQRKGLSIGGHTKPLFVLATDIEANRVYVGEGEDHKGLWRRVLRIAPDEIHWMRPSLSLPEGGALKCRVRIRYRQELQEAVLLMREAGLYVVFDQAQRSITPGQFAAFYAPYDESDPYDAPELLGSGVIEQ